jgi:hypothetical protein
MFQSGKAVRLLIASCLVGGINPAQAQEPDPRYRPEQLDCARFLETAESKILTQSGGRGREQTAGRTAVWQFRAAPAAGGVALEGWLDSLDLWRRSAETTIRPDTDGLIGGRYRGRLSADGAYSSKARPFVPDEVAEVSDMGRALDDFFPPLPPSRLHPGQSWSDSLGLTIRRLADSALSGVLLYRFALDSQGKTTRAETQADTVPLEVRQNSQEHGSFVWHPTLGLVRRERRIVVETTVPPGKSVRQAVRSRVEQQILLQRDLSSVRSSACGSQ